MNKNDITGILTGIELTEAQIKAILDVNSADITKALNKQKDEIASTKQALTEAQSTIADLEKNKGDVAKLQEQIDAYKEADAQRQKAAKEAEEKAELENRFAAVTGYTITHNAGSVPELTLKLNCDLQVINDEIVIPLPEPWRKINTRSDNS